MTNATPLTAQTLVELFRMPSFLWLVLTGGAAAIAGYAVGTWSPSFLIRSHGLNMQQAGFLVGVVGGGGATIGTLVCGVLTDRLARRDAGWQIGVPLLGTLISNPPSPLSCHYPQPWCCSLVPAGKSPSMAQFWVRDRRAAGPIRRDVVIVFL